MKFTIEEEIRKVGYIEIDNNKFQAWAIKRMLEDLDDTDQYFHRILLDDSAVEEALEKRGVIWKSVRGSVAKGKNYEAFVKEFEEATGYEVDRD